MYININFKGNMIDIKSFSKPKGDTKSVGGFTNIVNNIGGGGSASSVNGVTIWG
jgi:hypothetical protein